MEESSRQASEIVGQLPEILGIIFSKFNIKTLCRAATVNKLWNAMATYELKKRRPQIIVLPVSNVLDVIKTKPAVTLFFVNSNDMPTYHLMKNRTFFPNYMVVVPTDVVMMDEKQMTSSRITHRHVIRPANNLIALLIPQYRDLEIRATYDADLPERMRDAHDDTLNQVFLNEILPKDTESKATFIIIGRASFNHTSILELLKTRMKEREQDYVIWGAAFTTTPFTKYEFFDPLYGFGTQNHGIFGMSFTGSSVESSSILIKLRSARHVLEKLKDFREKLQLKRHSIGLLCSTDLKIHEFSEPDVAVFWTRKYIPVVKNIFPEVTIIGLFDHGNIRCYGLDAESDDPKRKLERKHSLSLMILTYD